MDDRRSSSSIETEIEYCPSPADEQYMRQCFELALQAEGRTSPNPMVGALVVQPDGNIAGRGFHPKAGQPHAEVFALDQAGEQARGATIYVSLEPCCHHGKTPPCTDRVIASGVKKVVAAMLDPNPKVAGGGFERLRAAGIEVVSGVLEEEARWLNRAFIKRITSDMPWVCLKMATTLDGKIADRNRLSQWITGQEARWYVHALRNQLDCVLIGAGTARQDNPRLNVRDYDEKTIRPRPVRHPIRAIVDGNLTVAPEANVCDSGTGGNTIIYCREKLAGNAAIYPDGVQVVGVPAPVASDDPENSTIDLTALLKDLKNRNISSVLCEGGARLAGSLLEDDLVDEIVWMIAPALLGDKEALSAIDIGKAVPISLMKRFRVITCQPIGDDIVIRLARK